MSTEFLIFVCLNSPYYYSPQIPSRSMQPNYRIQKWKIPVRFPFLLQKIKINQRLPIHPTALPTRYTPSELLILEYDENKKTDYPDDSLFVTTVPSRRIGGPPDPDGHSEWLVHGSTKKKILNTPGYPQPVPKPPGNVKSHVVKSTPTMGKGVFATRNIPMGDIIFAERPLLVCPRALIPATDMDLSAYTREDYTKIVMFEREQQLEAAVGRMDPDTKARLMALMNSHLEDGSGPINGIVRTNGYAVDNFWDGDVQPDENNPAYHYYFYSVVCDVGSRINHRSVFLFFSRLASTHSIHFPVVFQTSPTHLNSLLLPWSSWPRGTSKPVNNSSIHTAATNNPPPTARPSSHPTVLHNVSVPPASMPPRKPTPSARPTVHGSQSTNCRA